MIGELALGNLRQRELVLGDLGHLPQASVATDSEILPFINRHAQFVIGIGYVDAHLLAAVLLTSGATLWTRDRRLRGAAVRLAVAMPDPS